MTNTLFLRLEGPLQAWGLRARWSVRDTAMEPTKSGIVGLLACAQGLRKDEDLRNLSASLTLGIRVDRAGTVLTDFHTVGGGQKEPALLSAQGKPKLSRGKPHVEVSHRYYLCDASFLVAVQGKSDLISALGTSLESPVWVVYLGRKSCPPGKPILSGVGQFDDLQAALLAHDWPGCADKPLRAVIESKATDASAVDQYDHITSRQYRVFSPRYVRTVWLHRDAPE